MDPIASAAQQGLINASQSFDKASVKLQNTFADPSGGGDAAGAVVDQQTAKTAFVASTDVLKSAQDMFKALLDITV